MIKFFRIIFVIAMFFAFPSFVIAEDVQTLSAGISLNEQIPVDLMGTWRVASVLKETDSPTNFKKMGVDIWNLSKIGNVITLSNPFTGATASIEVTYVKNNNIKFSKRGTYDRQNLEDIVELTLTGDKFLGINRLKLETVENGTIMKSKSAIYVLRGEKISGSSVIEK